MATRLNNFMRQDIERALLDHRFKAERDRLSEESLTLGEEAYDAYYGKWKEKMDAFPENAFRTSSTVQVGVGGQRHNLFMKEERPVFYDDGYWNSTAIKLYASDDPFGARVHEQVQAAQKLREAEYQASSQVRSALKQFSTAEKLLETWPEAESIIRPVLLKYGTGKAASPLPVVVVSSLNAVLGLPPEDDKE